MGSLEVRDGSSADLERFVEICGRVERSGGWHELTPELRQEVVNFGSKHARDLEDYARILAKGIDVDGKFGTCDMEVSPSNSLVSSQSAILSPAHEPSSSTSEFAGSLLGDLFSLDQMSTANASVTASLAPDGEILRSNGGSYGTS